MKKTNVIKIASWNVNSLTVRCEQVLAWLKTTQVDILALQETKLNDASLLAQRFIEKGYYVVFSGQKTYNGVAIISRMPIDDVILDIPNFPDPQRRLLAATIAGIRIINLYVPNGSFVASDKYNYKLFWLKYLTIFIRQQLTEFNHVVVLGDFNIAPEDRDVYDPTQWQGQILVSLLERQAFKELLKLGLYDSFRLFSQDENQFSWWDYRANSFRRNHGLRIDHILLNANLAKQCISSHIDTLPRQVLRPSDHAPMWVLVNHE
jgi:exodeoxyribonuclease-3